MLRVGILIGLLLTACGGSTKGPAWPKRADAETDGGESLAPRTVSPLVASELKEEVADMVSDLISVDKAPDDKPTDTARTPSTTTPTTTAPEDVINLDDLTIEIDD